MNDQSSILFAVNGKTGKRAWRFKSGRCVASTPAVSGHTVFQSFMNKPPCNSKRPPGRLEGEVKEREEAFQAYDEAVSRGHGAALLTGT